MLTVALITNVVVFSAVVVAMVARAKWVTRVFGTLTPSRSLVLANYLAFLSTSVLFLVWPLEPGIITLVAIEIVFLVLSAFAVRVLSSPVVIGNLLYSTLLIALLVGHSLPTY